MGLDILSALIRGVVRATVGNGSPHAWFVNAAAFHPRRKGLEKLGTLPDFDPANEADPMTTCPGNCLERIDFAERRNAATTAKKKLIEKMKLAPKADDPKVIARRAAKAALSASNALLRDEGARLKREAGAQQKADDDARALADDIAAKSGLDAAAQRSLTEKAEQKAERDRRYAARKTRGR